MELEQTVLITQARSGSTRLPKKVLLTINDQELLKIHLDRLKKSSEIDHIIVATTVADEDKVIVDLCKQWGISSFRGAVDDVLDRFYQAARKFGAKWIVRVTSDCPLIDPDMVDAVIKLAKINDLDYAANILEERFPDGQDVEVFKFSALERAWKEAKLKSDREHVTLYIRSNSTFKGGTLFKALNFPSFYDYSNIRMTVDEPHDFELISELINQLGTSESWITYTKHIIETKLDEINKNIIRNEGLLKSLKND
ncbi:MAG: glycosyltransferase family protein [Pedobacter sp.]|uniref:glycosyltransferase family protein n=1 Tax=Pedobacter sp. TaxID=1411316 RepID=UPI002809524C|nr:glycosyltransferase family protein [Pedobacter sp.]MDQ8004325.1 glycosyltransferase family protein [Pedobacter sp.]